MIRRSPQRWKQSLPSCNCPVRRPGVAKQTLRMSFQILSNSESLWNCKTRFSCVLRKEHMAYDWRLLDLGRHQVGIFHILPFSFYVAFCPLHSSDCMVTTLIRKSHAWNSRYGVLSISVMNSCLRNLSKRPNLCSNIKSKGNSDRAECKRLPTGGRGPLVWFHLSGALFPP